MDQELLKQIEDASEAYAIEIYPARRGLLLRKQWRARIISESNRFKLFSSSESYNNRGELRDICEQVFPHLPIRIVAF